MFTGHGIDFYLFLKLQTWGIGTIGESMDKNLQAMKAEGDADATALLAAQQECEKLQGVMGTEPAVWLKLTQIGQLDENGGKTYVSKACSNYLCRFTFSVSSHKV